MPSYIMKGNFMYARFKEFCQTVVNLSSLWNLSFSAKPFRLKTIPVLFFNTFMVLKPIKFVIFCEAFQTESISSLVFQYLYGIQESWLDSTLQSAFVNFSVASFLFKIAFIFTYINLIQDSPLYVHCCSENMKKAVNILMDAPIKQTKSYPWQHLRLPMLI